MTPPCSLSLGVEVAHRCREKRSPTATVAPFQCLQGQPHHPHNPLGANRNSVGRRLLLARNLVGRGLWRDSVLPLGASGAVGRADAFLGVLHRPASVAGNRVVLRISAILTVRHGRFEHALIVIRFPAPPPFLTGSSPGLQKRRPRGDQAPTLRLVAAHDRPTPRGRAHLCAWGSAPAGYVVMRRSSLAEATSAEAKLWAVVNENPFASRTVMTGFRQHRS